MRKACALFLGLAIMVIAGCTNRAAADLIDDRRPANKSASSTTSTTATTGTSAPASQAASNKTTNSSTATKAPTSSVASSDTTTSTTCMTTVSADYLSRLVRDREMLRQAADGLALKMGLLESKEFAATLRAEKAEKENKELGASITRVKIFLNGGVIATPPTTSTTAPKPTTSVTMPRDFYHDGGWINDEHVPAGQSSRRRWLWVNRVWVVDATVALLKGEKVEEPLYVQDSKWETGYRPATTEEILFAGIAFRLLGGTRSKATQPTTSTTPAKATTSTAPSHETTKPAPVPQMKPTTRSVEICKPTSQTAVAPVAPAPKAESTKAPVQATPANPNTTVNVTVNPQINLRDFGKNRVDTSKSGNSESMVDSRVSASEGEEDEEQEAPVPPPAQPASATNPAPVRTRKVKTGNPEVGMTTTNLQLRERLEKIESRRDMVAAELARRGVKNRLAK